MKRILIDTNAYAAFKRNDPATLEVMRTAEYIGINTVVLGELYSGFKGEAGRTETVRNWPNFWILRG